MEKKMRAPCACWRAAGWSHPSRSSTSMLLGATPWLLVLLLCCSLAESGPAPLHLEFLPESFPGDHGGRSLKVAAQEADTWHVGNGTQDALVAQLTHLDHVDSRFRRNFSSRLEMVAAYAAMDRARFAALEAQREGREPSSLDQLADSGSSGVPASSASSSSPTSRRLLESFTSPLHNGLSIFGQYYLDFFVGTPPQRQSLVLDTASDLTWVQCQCKRCSKQADPEFKPQNSSTYVPVKCNTQLCSRPEVQYSRDKPRCFQSPEKECPYRYIFGSGFTLGALVKEKITLTTTAGREYHFRNFVMGCGQRNKGLTYAAGVLGLGRTFLGLPSQMRSKAGNVFSTCLVSQRVTRTNQVVFGPAGVPTTGVTYTRLLDNRRDFIRAHYYVPIAAVYVAGKRVPISQSGFALNPSGSGGGTILDTSTTYGLLNELVWGPLLEAIQAEAVDALRVEEQNYGGQKFSPCWAYSTKSRFPVVKVVFQGGAWLQWSPNNYLALLTSKVVCNVIQSAGKGGNILGSFQLQNTVVVYDNGKKRVGFKPVDCATWKPS